MSHTFSTTEEVRLSALRYAEMQLQSRGEYSAEELVESAKTIEAYIKAESE